MTAALGKAAGGLRGSADPFAVDVNDVLDVLHEHWDELYSGIGCTDDQWHAMHRVSGDVLTDETADGLVRQFIARLGMR
jgi:hypothetical protein